MLLRVQDNTDCRLEQVRTLFTEYAASLGVDLGFQDFEAELAGLPGAYVPPDGVLLLALVADQAAGCVALRRLDDTTCEMKRLYVRPAYRGAGLGKQLAKAIIAEARTIGYRAMRLDSLPSMLGAVQLYRSLGFQEIDPYRYNPIPGSIFLEISLEK